MKRQVIPTEEVRRFLRKKRWYLDMPACGSEPDSVTDLDGHLVCYLSKPVAGTRELIPLNEPEEPDARNVRAGALVEVVREREVKGEGIVVRSTVRVRAPIGQEPAREPVVQEYGYGQFPWDSGYRETKPLVAAAAGEVA